MSTGAVTFAALTVLVWALLLIYVILLGRNLTRGAGGPWIQFGITWGAVLAASLVLPLRSFGALVTVLMISSSPAIAAMVLRRSYVSPIPNAWRSRRGLAAVAALLMLALGIAVQVPGPVSAFDSGLYHLSAITQAADYGSLRGVGNLYAPYGYHNGLFPFAGFLTAVTGSAEAFRLVNGFLLLLAFTDLLSRWVSRKRTAGTYVLAVGLAVVLALTLTLGDFWLVSPTPDAAAFVLYVVMTAYVVDALAASCRSSIDRNLSVVMVIGALAGSVRPLYLLPAAIGVLVIGIYRARTRADDGRRMLLVVSALVGSSVVALGLARDILLSGWLWYPLGFFPIGVPWSAPDPTPVRELALAFNRSGFATPDFATSAQGWEWIGPWFAQYLPSNAGTVGFLAATVAAAIVAAIFAGRLIDVSGWGRMVLATSPSVITALVWFVATPPALRFAWGPLFMIPIVVLSWSLAALRPRDWVMGGAVLGSGVIVIASVVPALNRFDPGSLTHVRLLGVPATVQSLPEATYVPLDLPSGARIVAPDGPTYQCWGEPMCSPERAPGLDGRGTAARDGFVHAGG